MMDYLDTDIHLKATSEGQKMGEEKGKTPVCFLIAQGLLVGVCVCVCMCVLVLDASLALVLKKGRQVPPSPFPPLITASWVQADSSSCLLSLIYQARADKCKHLPEYPPHLGALGGWMCSIFYPIRRINALFSPGCLSNLLCTVFFSSTFTPRPKHHFLQAAC